MTHLHPTICIYLCMCVYVSLHTYIYIYTCINWKRERPMKKGKVIQPPWVKKGEAPSMDTEPSMREVFWSPTRIPAKKQLPPYPHKKTLLFSAQYNDSSWFVINRTIFDLWFKLYSVAHMMVDIERFLKCQILLLKGFSP